MAGASYAAGLLIVIKVGTSSLIRADTQSVNLTNLAKICEAVRRLQDLGHRVCIVSSGAVGMGCQVLRLQERPEELATRQALAAIGQGALMRAYTDFFAALSITCGQVLITAESLASSSQYALAKQTFAELLRLGAVPVVNENDTINVQELRYGDNDTLSAQVAALVEADWLILLTDVDFLYTANPRTDPTATPIEVVENVADLEVDTSTAGTQWGTGGMATKLTAARIACAAGCSMAICNSERPEAIEAILAGERKGTVFRPLGAKMAGAKRWILSVPVRGVLHVDAGCANALLNKTNLYAAGITELDGTFEPMDAVAVLCNGAPVARALVNHRSEDVARMKGLPSGEFPREVDIGGVEAVAYRNNVALLATPTGPLSTEL